jgi:predicted Ser/Thr protein kinase/Flp pilus assembly protein TadD
MESRDDIAAVILAAEQKQSMVGRTLGHYQIVSLLGAGGMGEVFRARDSKLDRTVALKILPSAVAADQQRMRRFVGEAKAASALNHPNVAHIYEIGEAGGVSFIAMEYVEGQTLAAKIGDRPLEVAEVIEIGIQAADALDEAHGKGITHRDLKPANIMLTPRGQVKVLDFGLAKINRPGEQDVDTSLSTLMQTTPGVVMGTVPYMSPEQALGRDVDHRSDIFSLGAVLYELATARRPFSGMNASETVDLILHAQPEAISRFNHDVPEELERIVGKCLEKEREQRYQSAGELLVDLKNLKRGADSGAGTTQRVVLGRVGQRRRSMVVALAVSLLVLGSIGLYLLWGRSPAIDSVAVLPFVNASALGQAYVAFVPCNIALGDLEFQRALELSPSLALAHQYLGGSLGLQSRLDESLAEYLKARELDPLSPIIARQVAFTYFFKRDYVRAIELVRQSHKLGPAFIGTVEIEVYIQNGLFNETLAELENAKRERQSDPILVFGTGMVYATQGKREAALQIIKQLEAMSGAGLSQAQSIAKIYLALSEKELAFGWLERGLQAGAIGLFFKDEPVWDPIRTNPRFADLLRRMGIPE